MAWTVHRPAHVRRKICAADSPRRTCSCTNLRCRFPPCWHGCRCPLVWTSSLFRQALDHKSSRLIVSTCCRFYRLCRFRRLCRFQANAAEADTAAESADTAAESADTVPRAATAPVSKPAVFLVEPWTIQPVQTHRQHLLPIPTLPAVPEPALFRQRVPSTTFPAWTGQSGVQPMFVKQSALPIFPAGGMAATAPMSRPAVFSIKPWTVQSRDPGNAAGSRPSLRDVVPLEGLGGDESERHVAESQWIVAARPLCHLQYTVAYLSRLQRILPAARWELYVKAARAALSPRGLGQRHVPPGPRGPYCRSAIGRWAHASHLARILT